MGNAIEVIYVVLNGHRGGMVLGKWYQHGGYQVVWVSWFGVLQMRSRIGPKGVEIMVFGVSEDLRSRDLGYLRI